MKTADFRIFFKTVVLKCNFFILPFIYSIGVSFHNLLLILIATEIQISLSMIKGNTLLIIENILRVIEFDWKIIAVWKNLVRHSVRDPRRPHCFLCKCILYVHKRSGTSRPNQNIVCISYIRNISHRLSHDVC